MMRLSGWVFPPLPANHRHVVRRLHRNEVAAALGAPSPRLLLGLPAAPQRKRTFGDRAVTIKRPHADQHSDPENQPRPIRSQAHAGLRTISAVCRREQRSPSPSSTRRMSRPPRCLGGQATRRSAEAPVAAVRISSSRPRRVPRATAATTSSRRRRKPAVRSSMDRRLRA